MNFKDFIASLMTQNPNAIIELNQDEMTGEINSCDLYTESVRIPEGFYYQSNNRLCKGPGMISHNGMEYFKFKGSQDALSDKPFMIITIEGHLKQTSEHLTRSI